MIKRIIASTFLIALFIAIPLSIMGYKKVELGAPFLSFMNNVSMELDQFKIEIPPIPSIPVFDNAEGFQLILNAFIKFVNIFVTIINAISTLINIVIQLIQVIVLVVKNLITFKDNVASTNPLPVV